MCFENNAIVSGITSALHEAVNCLSTCKQIQNDHHQNFQKDEIKLTILHEKLSNKYQQSNKFGMRELTYSQDNGECFEQKAGDFIGKHNG